MSDAAIARKYDERLAELRVTPERRPTMGYWKKPHYHNGVDGGNLLLGPVQFNWFNNGFRVHFTWPFRNPRTVTLWQK